MSSIFLHSRIAFYIHCRYTSTQKPPIFYWIFLLASCLQPRSIWVCLEIRILIRYKWLFQHFSYQSQLSSASSALLVLVPGGLVPPHWLVLVSKQILILLVSELELDSTGAIRVLKKHMSGNSPFTLPFHARYLKHKELEKCANFSKKITLNFRRYSFTYPSKKSKIGKNS